MLFIGGGLIKVEEILKKSQIILSLRSKTVSRWLILEHTSIRTPQCHIAYNRVKDTYGVIKEDHVKGKQIKPQLRVLFGSFERFIYFEPI
jgi:hypothetical protein